MKGRIPQPQEIKSLKGGRPDRRPTAVSPAATLPECPAYLDDVAREEWGRMVKVLEPTGLLSPSTAPALALYCDAFSQLVEARADMRRDGVVSSTDQGSPKANPATVVAKDARSTMLKILEQFGLTPASRSRVAVAAEAPKDALAEFLKAQQKS